MLVLPYGICNIMQNLTNYVSTLQLGQGENFLLCVFNFLLNFQLRLVAAPLRECIVEVQHAGPFTAFHLY
jgi:hypothetical protein